MRKINSPRLMRTALALAVTESVRVPIEVKRVVGILATGFTLFTLIVQGTTLRHVIAKLGLDRLSPLDEGAEVVVGDLVEVQLTVRAKHASEYVHLRDPRGAGFEPETIRSGYRWDLGISYYSETRDSGANLIWWKACRMSTAEKTVAPSKDERTISGFGR